MSLFHIVYALFVVCSLLTHKQTSNCCHFSFPHINTSLTLRSTCVTYVRMQKRSMKEGRNKGHNTSCDGCTLMDIEYANRCNHECHFPFCVPRFILGIRDTKDPRNILVGPKGVLARSHVAPGPEPMQPQAPTNFCMDTFPDRKNIQSQCRLFGGRYPQANAHSNLG